MDKRLLITLALICFLINAPHMKMWFNPSIDGVRDYYEISNNMLDGKWMWTCSDYFFIYGCHVERNWYPFFPILLMPIILIFPTPMILFLVSAIFYILAVYTFKLMSDKTLTLCFMSLTYPHMFTGGIESMYLFFSCGFFYCLLKNNGWGMSVFCSLGILGRPSVGVCLLIVYLFYQLKNGLKINTITPMVVLVFMLSVNATNSNNMFLNKYIESSNYYHNISFPPDYTSTQKLYNFFHNLFLSFFGGLASVMLLFVFFVPMQLFIHFKKYSLFIVFLLSLGFVHSLYMVEPRYMLMSVLSLLVLREDVGFNSVSKNFVGGKLG